ncbi:hypothetical protein M422DRAFT_245918 [Sphaerobolus stellatus SS14]|nr:hypothetical protein M422DRAFT_245918 [Sphaerobolus stellatus SS14]
MRIQYTSRREHSACFRLSSPPSRVWAFNDAPLRLLCSIITAYNLRWEEVLGIPELTHISLRRGGPDLLRIIQTSVTRR